MTLQEALDRMEQLAARGANKECSCGRNVHLRAPSQDDFERLKLDIEIALRREREAVKA